MKRSPKFSCKYIGCPASFVGRQYLRRHEKKPHFKCECCGRHFVKFGLKKHLSYKNNPPVRRVRLKFPCKHFGCPHVYLNEDLLRLHEVRPHVRCTCGRHFLKDGVAKHLAQLKRRGLPHNEQGGCDATETAN